MPIISFVQTKGGTGKTTPSQGVACSKAFYSIALVELDPQGTLADWIGERIAYKRKLKSVKFYQLVDLDLDALATKLTEIVENNEAVILDVPVTPYSLTKKQRNAWTSPSLPRRSSEKNEGKRWISHC